MGCCHAELTKTEQKGHLLEKDYMSKGFGVLTSLEGLNSALQVMQEASDAGSTLSTFLTAVFCSNAFRFKPCSLQNCNPQILILPCR